MKSSLKSFLGVLKDVQHISALLVKGAIAAPLVAAWVKLGPPPAMLIGFLTTCAEVLTIILIFDAWTQGKKRTLQRAFPYTMAAFFVGIFVSISLLYWFSDLPPGRNLRIIEGFVLRDDLKAVVTSTYTEQDALRDAEYDPYQVWQRWSVVSMIVLLSVLWTATFSALASCLAIFVLKYRGSKLG